MSIKIPDSIEERIHALVSSGEFLDSDDVLDSAIAALEAFGRMDLLLDDPESFMEEDIKRFEQKKTAKRLEQNRVVFELNEVDPSEIEKITAINLSTEMVERVKQLLIGVTFSKPEDVLRRALELVETEERQTRFEQSIAWEDFTLNNDRTRWTLELSKQLLEEAKEERRKTTGATPNARH